MTVVWCEGDKFTSCMIFVRSGFASLLLTRYSPAWRIITTLTDPQWLCCGTFNQQIQLAFPQWHHSAVKMTHCNMMKLYTNTSGSDWDPAEHCCQESYGNMLTTNSLFTPPDALWGPVYTMVNRLVSWQCLSFCNNCTCTIAALGTFKTFWVVFNMWYGCSYGELGL